MYLVIGGRESCVCACEHVYITSIPCTHMHTCTCTCVNMFVYMFVHRCADTYTGMGWLRSVGSIKVQVSLAEYRPFYRAFLQKRPMI